MSEVARTDEPGGFPLLTLSGELDIASSPGLLTSFTEFGDLGDCLILDLREVTFIGSSPLGDIIGLHSVLVKRGGALAIISDHADLERIFEVSGLIRLLNIFPEVESAAAYLRTICDHARV